MCIYGNFRATSINDFEQTDGVDQTAASENLNEQVPALITSVFNPILPFGLTTSNGDKTKQISGKRQKYKFTYMYAVFIFT